MLSGRLLYTTCRHVGSVNGTLARSVEYGCLATSCVHFAADLQLSINRVCKFCCPRVRVWASVVHAARKTSAGAAVLKP